MRRTVVTAALGGALALATACSGSGKATPQLQPNTPGNAALVRVDELSGQRAGNSVPCKGTDSGTLPVQFEDPANAGAPSKYVASQVKKTAAGTWRVHVIQLRGEQRTDIATFVVTRTGKGYSVCFAH